MRLNQRFIYALFGIFLFVFCLTNFVYAQTTSPNHVNFAKSWLESDPAIGSAYKGKHTLIDDTTKTCEKRPIVSEEWWYRPPGQTAWENGSEPPEVETYELIARVTGQGVLHMSINGNTTHNYDVGTFRSTDIAPVRLTVERDISHHRTENFTVIRAYEDGYVSSYYDTCIRVKDKGFETEIKPGDEPLSATGSVRTSYINITKGTAKSLEKKFKASGGYPTIVSAEMGWGQTETSNWVWQLEKDAGNTSTPDAISGSSNVAMLRPILVSPSNDAQECSPCTTCPNCSRSVNSTTDHVKGTCPIGGTAAGCGQPVYNCTPEEEALQDAWHQERTCANDSVFALGQLTRLGDSVCGAKFRHCTQSYCFFRYRMGRGHSDSSISQSPSGVTNAYANSHLFEVPPDPEPIPVPSEPVDNTPDCSSCTDGCSACPSTTPPPAPAPTPTPGLRPFNGSTYYANGGDTYNMELTTSEAYSLVYWYVKPPGDTTTYGNSVETDSGDGSTTTATLSYTLPSGNGGTYRITAYIYYSDRIAEETYDVYVY